MKETTLKKELRKVASTSPGAKRLMIYWLLGFPPKSYVSIGLCSVAAYYRAKRELKEAGIDINETQKAATYQTTKNAALLTAVVAAGWLAGSP